MDMKKVLENELKQKSEYKGYKPSTRKPRKAILWKKDKDKYFG